MMGQKLSSQQVATHNNIERQYSRVADDDAGVR